MGTNYFAVKKKPRIVKVYEKIHLGKSSIGWKFAFQQQEQYHNYEEFKDFILNNKDYIIQDEYGRVVDPKDMIKMIDRLQENNNPDDFTYDKNVNGYRFCDEDFS